MRVWQYMYVDELLQYDTPSTIIANSVGLPVSVVNSIKDGAKLADNIVLQYEKDRTRCPKCGNAVKTCCYSCYQKAQKPGTVTEVIERPNTHNGYMLNVHLYKKGVNNVVCSNFE